MSEQYMEEEEKRITKEQVIAVGGTLLTSGILDIATHWNIPTMLGGAVAIYAAGKLTPEIMNMLIPGSDPESTAAVTHAVIDQLAPAPQNDELPQDPLSKLKRLAGMKSAPSGQPKKEPADTGLQPQREPLVRRENGRSFSPVHSLLQQRPEASMRKENGRAFPTTIPPQFTLESVLDLITAANEDWRIYYGQNGVGEAVSISIDDMYHVLDVSSSGKGKSNRFRLALMQLVNTCEVYYVNPLAAPVKAVKDARRVEVWAPLFERLANGKPMKSKEEIHQVMTALVNLIQYRSACEEAGDFSWQDQPVFAFVDELPEVFARCPAAVKMLDTIVRTGRQFCVFAYVASQTAAVEDIGQSTASQAQYKTRIYGGGDRNSSSRMMKGSLPIESEQALQTNGAGLTLMLAEGFSTSQFVRAPLVTNEALFEYLGLPPFNLEDWLPSHTTVPARHGNALNLLGPVSGDRPQPRRQIDREQPKARESAMTIEALIQLFAEEKIDFETFKHLMDKIQVTESEVSQPISSAEVEEDEPATMARSTLLSVIPTPTPVVQEKGPRASDIDLAAAIAIWNAGFNSENKLMRAFPGLTKYQAGLLRDRIIAHANAIQEAE